MGLINPNAFKKSEIIEMVKKGRNQWPTFISNEEFIVL